MSDATLYTETFIEHAGDGFRHRYYEVDGIIHIDYQEWVGEDGTLACNGEKGEWKTKSSFDGLWCDEIDKIVTALTIVASGYKKNG